MKWQDIFRLATRIFKTRLLRVMLTILGIGVGIGAIVFLVSLGYGLQRITIESIAKSESLYTLDVTKGESELLRLTQDTVEKVKKIEGVEKICPVMVLPGQLGYQNVLADVVLYGIGEDYFGLEGLEFLVGGPVDQQQKEVVVSKAVASLLKLTPKEIIGQQVSINGVVSEAGEATTAAQVKALSGPFKVVGVVDEPESLWMFVPISSVREVSSADYTRLKVLLSSRQTLVAAQEKLKQEGYQVEALLDLLDQVNRVFRVAKAALAALGFIALTVASIGMFNTMTISLLERTREIGIMKAVGIRRKDVFNLFLAEAGIVGLGGAVLGLIFAFTLSGLVNLVIMSAAKHYGGLAVAVTYIPPWFALVAVLFALAVALLTGIYPAWRAAKINPVDALRYE